MRLRGSFERARALLDEADMILARHDKAVVRDLAAKERDRLRSQLEELRDAMDRVPFDEHGFLESLAHADGEIDVHLSRWRKSEVREYLEAILMAVAVAFALRAFVIEAFKIPSGSMIPTLMVGDHIFVNKFSYGPAIPYTHSRVWTHMPPQRGDVMVFAFPEHPEQDFIKRVIAIPGDKLEARNGHPIINGWEVPSCRVGPWTYTDYDSPISRHEGDLYVEYLGDESYLTFYDHASRGFPDEYQGPYYAKEGEVWVMGDNRNNSHDSRMWFGGQGGGVPFENIRGRALFVWLSVSDNGLDWSREGVARDGAPASSADRCRAGAAVRAVPQEPSGRHEPAGSDGAAAGHEHAVKTRARHSRARSAAAEVAWVLALALGPACASCAATERAQQRDPMTCERNPNCAAGRGVYTDCSQQCSYDPACTDRCTEATVDQPKH